ncbi:MAG: protein kinase, partial [Planctomycetia bacterium]|nr:protein kinase [Planctomycetia bacterium]
MSLVAIDSFFEALTQSRLLTERQLADLKADVGASAAGRLPQDLAAQLTERKIITRWQAEMLLAGQTAFFLGKYKLLDELGRGGMGTVLKAEQVPLGRIVALKVMDDKLLRDKTAVARFHREIRAAAALAHPNVVTAFDADQAQNTHFLVMEFVEGESLDALIKREGRLAPAEACEYIRQAALGLQHAHELGMAHRDIKPANLLLTRTGDGKSLVKILDLGLARFTSESREEGELTSTGQVMGTPDYIAPEQARNTKSADIRSDIYSLGCTLFRLLAGKVPFDGDNVIEKITARLMDDAPALRTLRPDAPSALDAVVARMLTRDPGARFQTPAEVAAALAPFTAATVGQSHLRAAPPAPPARDVPAQIDPAVHRFLQDLAHEAAGEETSETIATRIPQSDDGATVIQGAAAAESTAATPAARKLISQREQNRRNVRRQIVFAVGGIVATVLLAAAWWGWQKSGETILTLEWPEDQRAGAAMELDGRTVSVPKSGPIRFVGPPGRRTLKLTRKGYLPIEEKLNLERGERRPVEPQWTATIETVRKQELADLRKRVSEFEKSQAAAPRDGKPAELPTVRDPAVAKLRADLLDARRRLAGTAESLASAKLMSQVPWPADAPDRDPIDPRDLAYLGNPAPAELVGVLGNTRLKHCGLALAVAWSPDGRNLASVGDDFFLRLWDPTTGYQKRAIPTAFYPIRSVAFSPDGKAVACRNGDKSVGLWEVETGREIRTLSGGELEFVAFSAHLEALVVIDHDVTIKLWNLATGVGLRTIERKRGKFIAADISNDGKLLAVATTENGIDVVNLETGEVARTLQGHERQVGALAFSPVEPLLASSADGEALTRLWDVTTGELRRTIPRYGRYSLAFSPDGKRLAVGDYSVLNILDVQTGDVVQSYADDLAQTAIRSAVFSPDGVTLAAAPGKAFLKLWNTSTGEEQPRHAGHRGGVNGVAVSPGGATVASAGDDRIVRFWDLAERRELEFAVPHSTGVRSLAYSPDGKLLATGNSRKSTTVAGAVNVWKIDAGAPVPVLTEPCFDGALSVAFNPTGERVLSAPGG